jgi:hypothetical protein
LRSDHRAKPLDPACFGMPICVPIFCSAKDGKNRYGKADPSHPRVSTKKTWQGASDSCQCVGYGVNQRLTAGCRTLRAIEQYGAHP